ncbi:hypothetical protein Glove_320g197 [Diversispora epigaea]|uniref:Uncharacterized protein n=1 Tax=Diversispora epigaea TaxID=1348612 RepID=A0A397HPC0_9GLOM|nr:hypothetical protein Glove_320g197 [Diversispora epigaea]
MKKTKRTNNNNYNTTITIHLLLNVGAFEHILIHFTADVTGVYSGRYSLITKTKSGGGENTASNSGGNG